MSSTRQTQESCHTDETLVPSQLSDGVAERRDASAGIIRTRARIPFPHRAQVASHVERTRHHQFVGTTNKTASRRRAARHTLT